MGCRKINPVSKKKNLTYRLGLNFLKHFDLRRPFYSGGDGMLDSLEEN
jgi:hypothetical protein